MNYGKTPSAAAPVHPTAPQSAPTMGQLLRIHVRIAKRASTVSIPLALVLGLESKFGHGFAHEQVKLLAPQYTPRPGYSRSFQVRQSLEKLLASA